MSEKPVNPEPNGQGFEPLSAVLARILARLPKK